MTDDLLDDKLPMVQIVNEKVKYLVNSILKHDVELQLKFGSLTERADFRKSCFFGVYVELI